MPNSLMGSLQLALRSVTGSAQTYQGDWHAYFDVIGVPQGQFNGRIIHYYNLIQGISTITSASAAENYFLLNGVTSIPTLSLDFSTGTLDPRITFTRPDATTCATYFGSNGRLSTAAANVARFNYSPTCGLLIEESRTNYLTQSRDITQAVWVKGGSTALKNQIGVDGAANSACLLSETATTGGHNVEQQNVTVPAGVSVTVSRVAKAGTRSYIAVYERLTNQGKYFNLSTGVVMGDLNLAPDSSKIESLGNGWYKCSITVTPAGTLVTATTYISTNGTSTNYLGSTGSNVLLDSGEAQVGVFPTSIINTTTAAVTRAADLVSISGANFGSWFNQNAGTFVITYKVADNAFSTPISFDSGLAPENSSFISLLGSGEATWFNGLYSIQTANAVAAGGLRKEAFSYTSNSRALCLNGGTVVTDSEVPWQAPPTAAILGSLLNGVQSINGSIYSCVYYPTKMSNAELQALTV
jgi:hypothetical protein